MRNPWLAKNPWMSTWMSGANTVGNIARAHASRNAARLMSESVEQMVRFWGAAAAPPPAKRRRKRSIRDR